MSTVGKILVAASVLACRITADEVRFRLEDPGAESVSVAGSFNNWDSGANQLFRSNYAWETTIDLDPGFYYYKFVVDGVWIPDPKNPDRINDGGEGWNSILRVGDPIPPTRHAATIPLPRDRLPRPVLEENPEFVELYYAAWDMAWAKVTAGTEENGFAARYMDEGFNELIYQWDTCFMAMFSIYGRDIFPVMASLDNFYGKQRDDGYIQRVYWESTGEMAEEPSLSEPMINPPLFAWVELRYVKLTGDSTRLARVLPILVKYFEWIDGHLESPHIKRLLYTSPLGSGMDNTPRDGVGRGGWVDMTAQQALAARCIAEIAGILGDPLVHDRFMKRHSALSEAINSLCWSSEESFYFDVREDGSISPVKHVGAFWTLLAGVCGAERMSALLGHLDDPREFRRSHRVPTLSADDPRYDSRGHYWRGGVWAPTNYMIVSGLRLRGHDHTAHEIALNHLGHMVDIFCDFEPDSDSIAFEERYGDGYHTIWECYAPERAEPATRWDNTFYSRQNFVGWSGLGPIAMLIEDILGFEVQGFENRIVWRITRTDRHGIRQLRLRDQLVDLLCDWHEGACHVHILSEEAFELVMVLEDHKTHFSIHPGQSTHTIAMTPP